VKFRRVFAVGTFVLLLAVTLSALTGAGAVIHPETQAIYSSLDTPFSLLLNLTANSTTDLTVCNISYTVPSGLNLMSGSADFSIPLIAQDVSNLTTWQLNASSRGSFFINPVALCDQSLAVDRTNWTIHVDVLNITSVVTSPSPVAKDMPMNISVVAYHLGGSYGVNATEVNVSFEGASTTIVSCSQALVSGEECTAKLPKTFTSEGTQNYELNLTSAEGTFWTKSYSFDVIDDLALRIDELDTVPLQPRTFDFRVMAIVNRSLTDCSANVSGFPHVIGEPNQTFGALSDEQSINWELNTTTAGQFTVVANLTCSDVSEKISRTINVGAASPRLALQSTTLPATAGVNTSFSFDTVVTNNGTLPTWANVTLEPGSLNMTSSFKQVCKPESDLLAEDGTCSVSWTVTPKEVGTISFNITLQGNGTSTNVSKSLTVYDRSTLEVDPISLDFGIMDHNTMNATLSFNISETSGLDDLYSIAWDNNTVSDIKFNYTPVGSLTKSTSQRINVTLEVPRGQAPGIYLGSVVIKPLNADSVTLNYTVNVSRTIACGFSSNIFTISSITQGQALDFVAYVDNNGNVPINVSVSGDTPANGASAVTGGSETNVAPSARTADLGGIVTAASDATAGSNIQLSTLSAYCKHNGVQQTAQATLRADTVSSSGGGGGGGGGGGYSLPSYQFAFWADSEAFTVRQGETLRIPFKILNSGSTQIKDVKVDSADLLAVGLRAYSTYISTIDTSNTAADSVQVDVAVSTELGKHNITLEACHTHDSIKECHTTNELWIDVVEATEETLAAEAAAVEAAELEVMLLEAEELTEENAAQATELSISEAENTLTVLLPQTDLKVNVTAEIVIKDLDDNVLFTTTRLFESMEGVSQVEIEFESELAEGEYQVFVSMKDLAGDVLERKTARLQVTGLAVTAAGIPTSSGVSTIVKNITLGLLISSFIAFLGIWGYTGEMPLDALIEKKFSFSDEVKKRARDAFAHGDYGAAERLQKKAATISKAEKQISFRIERLEEECRRLYSYGSHAKAREVQETIISLRKKLSNIKQA